MLRYIIRSKVTPHYYTLHFQKSCVFSRNLSSVASRMSTVKIALAQILAGSDKQLNIEVAEKAVTEAASNGAKIIALPECFNSPYVTTQFPVYAEPIPNTKEELNADVHITSSRLSKLAESLGIYLIGGSIPERGDDGKVYNSCVVYGPKGEILTKHRKVHLFDIDIPGKITFRESDTLTGGNSLATFDTVYGKVGVGICYDIRFPQLATILRDAGCKLLFYPGAFNMTTGPAHWELLQRARALDNQCYVAGVSIARNPESSYQAWGHSTIVNPWGDVVSTTDEKPSTVYAEIDFDYVDQVRAQIPVSKQARTDLYTVEWKKQ